MKQMSNHVKYKRQAATISMQLVLENRLLFDGAIMATAVVSMRQQSEVVEDAQDDPIVDTDTAGVALPNRQFFISEAVDQQPAAIARAASAGVPGAAALLVIDPRASGLDQLLQNVPKNVDIQILDPKQDGFQQIAEILQSRGDSSDIHVQVANVDGKSWLGASQVNQTLSASHNENLTDWGNHLSANANITFHDAQSNAKEAWLDQVHALTGANIEWANDNVNEILISSDFATIPALPIDHNPTELVFIDTRVAGYQDLLNQIDPNASVILLDPARDGIQQIAQAVSAYDNISAIHLISHGGTGRISLGSSQLTADSMQGEYADELTAIGQHLSQNADILVYGCNFGVGDKGTQAANLLASLTGSDVAVSTDNTGAAALGGNWALELTTGGIESATLQAKDWQGLLVTAPALTVPGTTQTTNEDTAKVFSVANGNAITVSDFDDEPQTITLTVTNGSLTLGSLAGITFSAGDGTNDTTMTFTGSVATVNSALNGLAYQPTANYNGSAQITVRTSDPSSVAPGWVNGGFEQGSTTTTFQIVSETAVVGWDTDATDNRIEIWRSGFQGVPSHSGNYFAEMNANQVGALFQTFNTEANSDVKVTFAHRGRQGVDTMRVNVYDLGADDAVGGTGVNADTLLFSKTYSDGNTAWGVYNETVTNSASGNAFRFEFRSISAAGGIPSIGNFVDSINIVQAFADVKAINLNIQAVNDAPTVSLPGSISTSEDTPTAITGINFADIDGGNTGVDVTFNVPPGTGTLSWVNTPFISAVVSDGGRTITLGGTKVAIRNAIAANALSFAPTANFNGNVALTVSIDDRGNTGLDPGLSGTPTSEASSGLTTIVVAPMNDPPTATPLTTSGSEDTPIPVNLAGTDIDGAVTNVTITNLPPASEGILYFADGTTPVVAGVPITAAQAAGLLFTPAPNFNGSVSLFNFTVTDNQGGISSPVAASITVAPINDAPVAISGSINSLEDTDAPVILTGTDIDGTVTSVTVTSLPPASQGTLFFANGTTPVVAGVPMTTGEASSLVFRPALNFNGIVTTPFTVLDNESQDSDPGSFVIDVQRVNDDPIATPVIASGDEDTPLTVSLTGTDVEDGTATSVSVVSLPPADQGILYLADGTTPVVAGLDYPVGNFIFVPTPNFNGSVDPIPFTVKDSVGQVSSPPVNLTITIDTVNDPPVANNDGPIPTSANVPVSGNVITGAGGATADVDVEGDTLTVTQFFIPGVGTFAAGVTATIPEIGTLVINSNGGFTFTPETAYDGPVPTATYTLSDSNPGGTDTATLSFADVPNTPPVATNDGPINLISGTPASGNVITGTGGATADSDADGDILSITGFTVEGLAGSFNPGDTATIADVGSLLINEDGSFTFTPIFGYDGPVPDATYTVTDGTVSANAILIFTDIVNIPPTATAMNVVGNEDSPVLVDLAGTDADGTLANVAVTSLPLATQGVLFLADGVSPVVLNSPITPEQAASLVFSPAPGYNGPALIQFTVTDDDGAVSVPATANISILPVNDSPVANGDGVIQTAPNTSVSGNLISGTGGGQADTDPDGDVLSISQYQIDSNSDGILETITVPPGGSATTTLTNAAGQQIGTLAIASNGDFTFLPARGYDGPVPNAVYTLSDGVAFDTATLSFAPVPNTPPEAGDDGPVQTTANAPTRGDLLQNDRDPDGDLLSVTQFTIPGVGTFTAGTTARIPGVGSLVINPDGSYSFTPKTGYAGPVPRVSYTVSDGTDTTTAVLRFADVPGTGNAENIGAIIQLANPTPSLFPQGTGGAYSLPQFREFDLLWASDKPYDPSRLSLTRDFEKCDLYLKGSLRNRVVIEKQYYNFSVPREAFCHCNINEELEFVATQVDGTPLPSWLRFDPKQLKFTGVPPKDARNTEIMITAHDQYGNSVHATFKVVVNKDKIDLGKKGAGRPGPYIKVSQEDGFIKDDGAVDFVVGKAGFNEQLGQTGKLTRLMESRALLYSLRQL